MRHPLHRQLPHAERPPDPDEGSTPRATPRLNRRFRPTRWSSPAATTRNPLLEPLVGREIAPRLRERYRDVTARIAESVQDDVTRLNWQARADLLDPDRWKTPEAVLQGLQTADRLLDELRRSVLEYFMKMRLVRLALLLMTASTVQAQLRLQQIAGSFSLPSRWFRSRPEQCHVRRRTDRNGADDPRRGDRRTVPRLACRHLERRRARVAGHGVLTERRVRARVLQFHRRERPYRGRALHTQPGGVAGTRRSRDALRSALARR